MKSSALYWFELLTFTLLQSDLQLIYVSWGSSPRQRYQQRIKSLATCINLPEGSICICAQSWVCPEVWQGCLQWKWSCIHTARGRVCARVVGSSKLDQDINVARACSSHIRVANWPRRACVLLGNPSALRSREDCFRLRVEGSSPFLLQKTAAWGHPRVWGEELSCKMAGEVM